jgi:hypothetical protein
MNKFIHIDRNPNNWPYYVLVADFWQNKLMGSHYFGFNSIAEAKEFMQHPENKYCKYL